MRQVVQPTGGGPVRVIEVPCPTAGPTEVLVRTVATLISTGTERAVTEQAGQSLLAKARARPDLVRQVARKARSEGLRTTMRNVQARLDDEIALGYSGAGIALSVGEAVAGVRAGQLVATGGAYRACHAEFQAVPGMLCVPVPGGVAPEHAAFATVGAIALHGLRTADVGPGAKVAVIGLGLVGQLTSRLALAAGCDVAGIDVADFPVDRASAAGVFAQKEAGADTTAAIVDWARGRGVDAVILTAAGKDSAAVQRAPVLCRDRANVVIVGDVGLGLSRAPYYARELSLRFARSYGPGRYDPSYEEWGVDYPVGYVPFAERRNLETVLDLMASGRLAVDDLITHRFPVPEAPQAYALMSARTEPFLGIELVYDESASPETPVTFAPRTSASGRPGVGFIGAGGFASGVLVPAFKQAGLDRLVAVTSASGLSARAMGQRAGFERAVSGVESILVDPDVEVVVVATRHDSHASITAQALRVGKHVFCEKPLALTVDELDEVEDAYRSSDRVLFVGFNRRFSPSVLQVRQHFAQGAGPIAVTYRVSAGRLPEGHWYHDRRQGGRLLGEVCHFVDTCAALVGQNAVEAHVVSAPAGETLLREDVGALLTYPDGSFASIVYVAGGHPSTEKERVEVLGRGRSAVICDYTSLTLDGRTTTAAQNKGHRAEVQAFRDVLDGRMEPPDFIASMRTTLGLAAALSRSA